MRLIRTFAQNPAMFWSVILVGIAAGVAGGGQVAIVNTVLAKGPSNRLLLSFVVLSVVRLCFGGLGQLGFASLGHRAICDFRKSLSRAIVAMPLGRLEEIGAPKLYAALSHDINTLGRAGYMLSSAITQVAFVSACMIYLGVLWPSGLGFVLLILVAGVGLTEFMARKSKALMSRGRDDQDLLYAGFRGLTLGAKELKLHAGRRAEFTEVMLEAPSLAHTRKESRGMALSFVAGQWQTLLFLVLVGALLYEAPSLGFFDTPLLRSYVLTLLAMQASVQGLLQSYPLVQSASISFAKLDSLGLSVREAPKDEGEHATLECKHIELRDIIHEYRSEDDTPFSLGPINLDLRPGEIVFVVGGNGSGKSTLIKVLTGLYVPRAGEIRVDGKVVDDSNREAYRQAFSAVFADWYLFERLHGIDSNALEKDAPRYLTELRLDKKVHIKNGEFSTTDLSTGQRKRLMLLTAYLEDRPVYVFDEWASDQDPSFKKVFYAEILPRLKERGKMIVVVSHDDAYFSVADRIVHLESGKRSETIAA